MLAFPVCLHSRDATFQGSKLEAKVLTMAPLPRQAPNCNSDLPRSERLLKVPCTYCATYKLADTWGEGSTYYQAHFSALHSSLGSWPLSAALLQRSPDRSYIIYIHDIKAYICFSSIHSGRINMIEAILKKAWRNPRKKTANCTSELLDLTCFSNFPAPYVSV